MNDYPTQRMSLEHAGEVFRAQRGDSAAFPLVTLEEAMSMQGADTFEQFLERNKGDYQFYG